MSVVQLVKDSRPVPNQLSLTSRTSLAKPFGHTAPDVVSEICRRVRVRVHERGLCTVLSGDNSLVLFRLQPSQDGLLSPSPAFNKQKRVRSEIDESKLWMAGPQGTVLLCRSLVSH